MKLSIEWIRDYVDLPADLSLKEIMHDLTMATVEVENAEDPGVALDHVVVGRIVEVATLDAKDASLATCDIGGSAPVHIVCSGTGMAPGVDTIGALPGARIRPTGRHDHVVVAAREAAGITAHAPARVLSWNGKAIYAGMKIQPMAVTAERPIEKSPLQDHDGPRSPRRPRDFGKRASCSAG